MTVRGGLLAAAAAAPAELEQAGAAPNAILQRPLSVRERVVVRGYWMRLATLCC